jgi:hypothetical protein
VPPQACYYEPESTKPCPLTWTCKQKPDTARQVLKLLSTKPCPLTSTCKKAGHSKTSVEAACSRLLYYGSVVKFIQICVSVHMCVFFFKNEKMPSESLFFLSGFYVRQPKQLGRSLCIACGWVVSGRRFLKRTQILKRSMRFSIDFSSPGTTWNLARFCTHPKMIRCTIQPTTTNSVIHS